MSEKGAIMGGAGAVLSVLLHVTGKKSASQIGVKSGGAYHSDAMQGRGHSSELPLQTRECWSPAEGFHA